MQSLAVQPAKEGIEGCHSTLYRSREEMMSGDLNLLPRLVARTRASILIGQQFAVVILQVHVLMLVSRYIFLGETRLTFYIRNANENFYS